jgi:hypothetical protein
MRIIPRSYGWFASDWRRISDQAPREARRLYALALAVTWVSWVTITVPLLSGALWGLLFIMDVDTRDSDLLDRSMSIAIVCLLVGIFFSVPMS